MQVLQLHNYSSNIAIHLTSSHAVIVMWITSLHVLTWKPEPDIDRVMLSMVSRLRGRVAIFQWLLPNRRANWREVLWFFSTVLRRNWSTWRGCCLTSHIVRWCCLARRDAAKLRSFVNTFKAWCASLAGPAPTLCWPFTLTGEFTCGKRLVTLLCVYVAPSFVHRWPA